MKKTNNNRYQRMKMFLNDFYRILVYLRQPFFKLGNKTAQQITNLPIFFSLFFLSLGILQISFDTRNSSILKNYPLFTHLTDRKIPQKFDTLYLKLLENKGLLPPPKGINKGMLQTNEGGTAANCSIPTQKKRKEDQLRDDFFIPEFPTIFHSIQNEKQKQDTINLYKTFEQIGPIFLSEIDEKNKDQENAILHLGIDLPYQIWSSKTKNFNSAEDKLLTSWQFKDSDLIIRDLKTDNEFKNRIVQQFIKQYNDFLKNNVKNIDLKLFKHKNIQITKNLEKIFIKIPTYIPEQGSISDFLNLSASQDIFKSEMENSSMGQYQKQVIKEAESNQNTLNFTTLDTSYQIQKIEDQIPRKIQGTRYFIPEKRNSLFPVKEYQEEEYEILSYKKENWNNFLKQLSNLHVESPSFTEGDRQHKKSYKSLFNVKFLPQGKNKFAKTLLDFLELTKIPKYTNIFKKFKKLQLLKYIGQFDIEITEGAASLWDCSTSVALGCWLPSLCWSAAPPSQPSLWEEPEGYSAPGERRDKRRDGRDERPGRVTLQVAPGCHTNTLPLPLITLHQDSLKKFLSPIPKLDKIQSQNEENYGETVPEDTFDNYQNTYSYLLQRQKNNPYFEELILAEDYLLETIFFFIKKNLVKNNQEKEQLKEGEEKVWDQKQLKSEMMPGLLPSPTDASQPGQLVGAASQGCSEIGRAARRSPYQVPYGINPEGEELHRSAALPRSKAAHPSFVMALDFLKSRKKQRNLFLKNYEKISQIKNLLEKKREIQTSFLYNSIYSHYLLNSKILKNLHFEKFEQTVQQYAQFSIDALVNKQNLYDGTALRGDQGCTEIGRAARRSPYQVSPEGNAITSSPLGSNLVGRFAAIASRRDGNSAASQRQEGMAATEGSFAARRSPYQQHTNEGMNTRSPLAALPFGEQLKILGKEMKLLGKELKLLGKELKNFGTKLNHPFPSIDIASNMMFKKYLNFDFFLQRTIGETSNYFSLQGQKIYPMMVNLIKSHNKNTPYEYMDRYYFYRKLPRIPKNIDFPVLVINKTHPFKKKSYPFRVENIPRMTSLKKKKNKTCSRDFFHFTCL